MPRRARARRSRKPRGDGRRRYFGYQLKAATAITRRRFRPAPRAHDDAATPGRAGNCLRIAFGTTASRLYNAYILRERPAARAQGMISSARDSPCAFDKMTRPASA